MTGFIVVQLGMILGILINYFSYKYIKDNINLFTDIEIDEQKYRTYPLIELLTGSFLFLVYLKFGLTFMAFKFAVLLILLLIVSIIDFKIQIIPNKIILPGMLIGVLLSLDSSKSLWIAFSGFLIGAGIIMSLFLISRGGIGGGDIKLLGLMGIFLGLDILFILYVAFIIGAMVGVGLYIFKVKSLKDSLPLAPFFTMAFILKLLL